MNFACRTIELSEVIKCSLGLNKSEEKILEYLMKTPGEKSSKEIANEFSIDLSTAQRMLKNLREKKLIRRSQTNLSPGGYIYRYSIKEKEQIKNEILDNLERFQEAVKKQIKKL